MSNRTSSARPPGDSGGEQLVLDSGQQPVEPVRLTAQGTQVFGQIRGAVTEITERLWRDLPASDLATADRVLSIITERASAELAAG